MTHPDFTTLFLATAKGGATSPPPSVAPHLSACEPCRGEWGLASSVREAIRSDRMVAPPAHVLKQAISLWSQAHPGRITRALEILRAALVFDSFKAPQLATVRRAAVAPSAGKPATRRLLYRAGTYEIELAIEPGSKGRGGARKQLRGQIAARTRRDRAGQDVTVRLVGASRRPIVRQPDERGMFRYDSIAPGEYSLHVRMAGKETGTGREIRIDSLTVPR